MPIFFHLHVEDYLFIYRAKFVTQKREVGRTDRFTTPHSRLSSWRDLEALFLLMWLNASQQIFFLDVMLVLRLHSPLLGAFRWVRLKILNLLSDKSSCRPQPGSLLNDSNIYWKLTQSLSSIRLRRINSLEEPKRLPIGSSPKRNPQQNILL